jgi:hypothetical protein
MPVCSLGMGVPNLGGRALPEANVISDIVVDWQLWEASP